MIFKNAIINDAVIFKMNDSELIPLTQDGETILLNSPTARCLQLLVERQGRVVSRDDFLEQVWGAKGIIVSQNTFYQNISLLRKSLKKAGLQEDIVVTVRRKGFTLSSDVVIKITEKSDVAETSMLVHQSTASPLTPVIREAESTNTTTTASVRTNLRSIPKWVTFLLVLILLIEIIIFFGFIYS
ncbi:winged helix-turn-helix domain-containing protein [Leclercia tamurae]|uniref:Winged helix-turn-helix domain-containing protein n=1 Tax=Leclercia tamurae TaxID=2926467 RepID=A0ABT2RCL8_9ENTR|nr:winged helix-turn-helix domain-containing protein [Leclercia tamurae]MCU6678486.1 winged helix-turn-helix domain-containing protein [Leclercia tamurae]